MECREPRCFLEVSSGRGAGARPAENHVGPCQMPGMKPDVVGCRMVEGQIVVVSRTSSHSDLQPAGASEGSVRERRRGVTFYSSNRRFGQGLAHRLRIKFTGQCSSEQCMRALSIFLGLREQGRDPLGGSFGAKSAIVVA